MKYSDYSKRTLSLINRDTPSLAASIESVAEMEVKDIDVPMENDQEESWELLGVELQEPIDNELLEDIREEINFPDPEEEDEDKIEELIEHNKVIGDSLESLYDLVYDNYETVGPMHHELRALGLGLENYLPPMDVGLEATLSGIAKAVKGSVIEGTMLAAMSVEKKWKQLKIYVKDYVDYEEQELDWYELSKKYENFSPDASDLLSVDLILKDLSPKVYPKTYSKLKNKRQVIAGEFLDVYLPELYSEVNTHKNPFANPARLREFVEITKLNDKAMTGMGAVRTKRAFDNIVNALSRYSENTDSDLLDDAHSQLQILEDALDSSSKLISSFNAASPSNRVGATEIYPKKMKMYIDEFIKNDSFVQQRHTHSAFILEIQGSVDSVQNITEKALTAIGQREVSETDKGIVTSTAEHDAKLIKELVDGLSSFVDGAAKLIETHVKIYTTIDTIYKIWHETVQIMINSNLDNITIKDGESVRGIRTTDFLNDSTEAFSPSDALSTIKNKLSSLKVVKRWEAKKMVNSETGGLGNKAKDTEFELNTLAELPNYNDYKPFYRMLDKEGLIKFGVSDIEKFLLLKEGFSKGNEHIANAVCGADFYKLHDDALTYNSHLNKATSSFERYVAHATELRNQKFADSAEADSREALELLTRIHDGLTSITMPRLNDVPVEVSVPTVMKQVGGAMLAAEAVRSEVPIDFFDDVVEYLGSPDEENIAFDSPQGTAILSNMANIVNLSSAIGELSEKLERQFNIVKDVDGQVVKLYEQLSKS